MSSLLLMWRSRSALLLWLSVGVPDKHSPISDPDRDQEWSMPRHWGSVTVDWKLVPRTKDGKMDDMRLEDLLREYKLMRERLIESMHEKYAIPASAFQSMYMGKFPGGMTRATSMEHPGQPKTKKRKKKQVEATTVSAHQLKLRRLRIKLMFDQMKRERKAQAWKDFLDGKTMKR